MDSSEDKKLNNVFDDFWTNSVDLFKSPSTNIVADNTQNLNVSKDTKSIQDFFDRIDKLPITEDSKETLKKMVDYARKYNEGILKNYIPFNMRLYSKDDASSIKIIEFISESLSYYDYIKSNNVSRHSLFSVEETKDIENIYEENASLGIVTLEDTNGILCKEQSVKDKLLKFLETSILKCSVQNGITTIIIDQDKEKIDTLLENNSTLKDKIFDYELTVTSLNIQDVYQSVLDEVKKDFEVSDKFELKLLDYITETLNKSTISPSEYTESLIQKILFNQTGNVINENTVPDYEKNKSTEEIFEELNALVGLENVKQMLKDLVNLIEFKNKTKDSINIKNTNLHMVFLGNPGTGKTTVARMIAGILYNLKYISQNKLIEVSAKDLIGQYVGQTAPKTMEIIEKALGGVLFIDEAYSLASGAGSSGNSFNEEAIATLIQGMENYRDNLVVIFAGYSKEMDAFLKSNSGIVSRIGYTMEFKDYTTDELIEILNSMFKKAGFIVTESAIQKARDIIEEYKKDENFGNARFIRNLYEKAVIEHSSNTSKIKSKKHLQTITENDITSKNLLKA